MTRLITILLALPLWFYAAWVQAATDNTPADNASRLNLESLKLQGQYTQGGMLRGQVPKGSTLRLNGKKLSQSSTGDFVIGFGRDDALEQELELITTSGKTVAIPFKLQPRTYKEQRIEGVPGRTVNPDPKHLQRIREEGRQVSQARWANSEEKGFLQNFIWPLQGPITGVYGSRRVYNGEPRRPHYGIDIAAPEGTEILAPADGVVTMAHGDMFFSGATMVIDHGLGINTSYLHMSKMLVKKGEKVQQGQVIGLVGATGRATGPHLCWRLNWFQTRLDPQLIVPAMAN